MQKRHLIAATLFAAAFPALAGTLAATTASPMHRIARADNVATRETTAGTSPLASDSARQKNTPAVKGGLLNSDVTPKQADAVSRDTNDKIARGEITPQRSPAPQEQPAK